MKNLQKASRTVTAGDPGNSINYATAATFQADGQMTGFTSGHSATFAGITNSFTYNNRLQPINMSAVSPSQTVFSIGYDFHWQNSDNGNVFAITNFRDATRSQSFTYDALNRLTSAQNAGTNCARTVIGGNLAYWGNNYTYDAWGNLTNKTKISTACAGEGLGLTVLANNRIANAGYGFDAAGNMTLDGTDAVSATYDAENRINGANGYTYTYDADGNRVEKSNGSTGTLYWYMTLGIVAESDLSGVLKSEYVFFNGDRIARRDFGTAGGVFYYFSDHLKTASVITDAAGNIKSDSDYYPWGGELQFVANDANHYKFTGKERDTETGLDYFGARYYSNGLGRFITPDWAAKAAAVPYADYADPQSLNLYTYVRNIPTTRFDIDGHQNDKSYFQRFKDALSSIFSTPPPPSSPGAVGAPRPNCTCPAPPQQDDKDNKKENNNNSFRQGEQGRDAQGKFTSKQPGQTSPGSAAEKEGLDSVGAVKNTEKLNGTVRDGTIPETGEHVEVKSGASVNNTGQLQKMGQAAMNKTQKPLRVVTTNPNVKVSGPAQRNPNLRIEPMKK